MTPKPVSDLGGVVVPLLAPFDAAGGLDVPSLHRLVDAVLDAGARGLWVNGTSGEFHGLDRETRARIVAAVAERCAGRGCVIAHVGDGATALAVEHARRARDAGADLVAAITPWYLDYDEAELARHHGRIADAAGGPIMLYQHPATGKPPLSADTVVDLVRAGVVIGLKESSRDLDGFGALIGSARDAGVELACFLGPGALAIAGLDRGGAGMIPIVANLDPAAAVGLHDAYRRGDRDEALRLQRRLDAVADRVASALTARTTWAPTICAYKWILVARGVFETATVLEPATPLEAAEIDALLAAAESV